MHIGVVFKRGWLRCGKADLNATAEGVECGTVAYGVASGIRDS